MAKYEISSALSLVIIMACVVIGAASTAVFLLYQAAIGREVERLEVSAKSQARLIEAVARFNEQESTDYPGGSYQATMSQILEAHESYLHFGETGEFTLAKLDGEKIVFLLSFHLLHEGESHLANPGHGHTPDGLLTVTVGSGLAEPMELALRGRAGTMVGKDYLGLKVLAAYEPVDVLNLGIVAKINVAEVRAPYLKAWVISSGISLLFMVIGTLLFGRITNPMVNRIRESEERFRAAFDHANTGMSLVDLEGNILKANAKVSEIFGYSIAELEHMNVNDLTHPEDQGITPRLFEEIKPGKMLSTVVEKRYLHKNGKLVYGLISIGAVKDPEGIPQYIISQIQDITERKQTEAELVEARNQAEQANVSKSRFLANMSHELRTPLAIVNGSAEILLEDSLGTLTEKQRKFVLRIQESGEHLLMIINDLLDLAKIEAGKLELEMEHLDLSALSRETCTMIELKAQEAGLEFELVGMDQTVLFYGDRLRLKQVLLNLLSNALKFTKAGTITTYLKKEAGQIFWGVRDTGIGIKEKLLEKLFQPFEQGEESLRKDIQGTGLGLALSRQIILAHGGNISVKSEFGHGADFRIVLPATKPGENN